MALFLGLYTYFFPIIYLLYVSFMHCSFINLFSFFNYTQLLIYVQTRTTHAYDIKNGEPIVVNIVIIFRLEIKIHMHHYLVFNFYVAPPIIIRLRADVSDFLIELELRIDIACICNKNIFQCTSVLKSNTYIYTCFPRL